MTDQTARRPAGHDLADGYKAYALFVLLAIYTSNFIDRTIINTLAQSIKVDLALSDKDLGWLSGLAFAAIYSILGLPLAWLADRFKRTTIITVSLAVWSLFTAACGLAQNFWQLFAMRFGVGVGEAGCSPAAQSLISDYYTPRRRSTALGIYSLGIPLGTLFGAVAAGWIAQTFGWRMAFVVVGLPGLALALIAQFTLREPARGGSEPVSDAPPTPRRSTWKVFKTLFGSWTFVNVCLGATLSSFAGYGIAAFAVPFLLRGDFGLDLRTAATAYGIVGGLSAAVGVFMGGFVTDVGGKLDRRMYVWVPALGFLIAAPLYVLAFQQARLEDIALYVVAPLILQYLYLGPTFAITHNMVEPRERAMATALLFLVLNLIALGFGPRFVGGLSDWFGQAAFNAAGGAGDFLAACPGGVAKVAGDAANCAAASFSGVKQAMIWTAAIVYAWAGVHYLLASFTLRKDLRT